MRACRSGTGPRPEAGSKAAARRLTRLREELIRARAHRGTYIDSDFAFGFLQRHRRTSLIAELERELADLSAAEMELERTEKAKEKNKHKANVDTRQNKTEAGQRQRSNKYKCK